MSTPSSEQHKRYLYSDELLGQLAEAALGRGVQTYEDLLKMREALGDETMGIVVGSWFDEHDDPDGHIHK